MLISACSDKAHLRHIAASGLQLAYLYRGHLLDIAGKMHKVVLSNKIKRVVTTIKIDDQKDKKLTAEGKIKSVQNKLRA